MLLAGDLRLVSENSHKNTTMFHTSSPYIEVTSGTQYHLTNKPVVLHTWPHLPHLTHVVATNAEKLVTLLCPCWHVFVLHNQLGASLLLDLPAIQTGQLPRPKGQHVLIDRLCRSTRATRLRPNGSVTRPAHSRPSANGGSGAVTKRRGRTSSGCL